MPTTTIFNFVFILFAFVECRPNRFYFRLPNDTETRIVGGSDIPIGKHVPYQVSLQYHTNNGKHMHFCGGSIIAPNRILTAAHCCQGLNVKRMSVVAGIRDLEMDRGVRTRVTSYKIHENYQQLITSDIAVLFVDPPFVYNNVSIAPIDINGKEFYNDSLPVTLTGWGLRLPIPFPFFDAVSYPNILQRMDYITISNQQCRDSGMEDVTDTEICARGLFRGACSGDSGGPLVTLTPNGPKQVGIVSYGMVVCGTYIAPDVYTRVSTFNDWLHKHIVDE